MAESTADLVAGRFRVGRLIGAGAQGRVVAAHDELLDRPVALKILQSSVPDSHARARFLREARAAAALVHPNVVTVFDIGAVDGPLTGDGTTPYIAMELVDGPSLAQVIADRGPLSITDAVEVTRQILAGLGAAHARGLLHRDVKPSNALLAPDGTVKLTDFGIATTAAGGMTLTEPGAVLGTVAYLAPERVAGEAATVASDLYAVGVVLYEMLAGTPPFRGDTAVAIALAHSTQAPPSLAERRAGLGEEAVGEELDALVGRALAKDPAARFASAAEMDAALAGTPTDRGVPRSATSRARTPAPAAAAAGAVAAGPPGGPW
ncbi:MAG: serine/threonine-protein kinase, partial [Kineosporiaceae bacterium]